MDRRDLTLESFSTQHYELLSGRVSARDLVEQHLAQIERFDPELNAFRVVLAEEALNEAAAVQRRIEDGDQAPLLGACVAVKDDTDVAGHRTCVGTSAVRRPAVEDSAVVARLRRAGAIILGKTHVPALTHAAYTESVAFGATRSPWDRERSAGGSTGGGGAAAAAGMCAMAHATDGAGSIRVPAAWNGLVGLKTTRGRIDLAPHLDAWLGLTQHGGLTRSAEDAARFAAATSTRDDDVLGTFRAPTPRLRIGVATTPPPGTKADLRPAARRAIDETTAALTAAGHEVRLIDLDYSPALLIGASIRVWRGIADEAARLDDASSLEPRVRKLARLGRSLPGPVVRWARHAGELHGRRLQTSFDAVDVVLTPGPITAPWAIGALHGPGLRRFLVEGGAPAPFLPAFNVAGLPTCSVPAGLDEDGLPHGVQLVGRPWSEATLLQLARDLQDARGGWRAPPLVS